MKKLVALLFLGLMATSAFAALDPDADSFGIYADTLGNSNVIGPIGATTKNVYLILMNPSTDIKGFELAYEIVPTPAMAPTFADDLLRVSQAISGGSFVDLGNSVDTTIGDFRCGYAVIRPAVPAMVMVTWRFRYFGDLDEGMQFFIRGVATGASGPSQGYPVVDGGSGVGLRQAGVASGDRLLPVATTLPPAPVAVDSESFGAVKALFR